MQNALSDITNPDDSMYVEDVKKVAATMYAGECQACFRNKLTNSSAYK